MVVVMTMIFVFGSNLAGIHGAGAAKTAMKNHGAAYGVGVGPTGNAYAIPTKDGLLRTLRLGTIDRFVSRFVDYARRNPDKQFQVTRIGCGLAGYKDEKIAPLFKDMPIENCFIDSAWMEYLPNHKSWGTF
jgi:hypothetical protein